MQPGNSLPPVRRAESLGDLALADNRAEPVRNPNADRVSPAAFLQTRICRHVPRLACVASACSRRTLSLCCAELFLCPQTLAGSWRRERDLNPRGVAPNTLSRRAP